MPISAFNVSRRHFQYFRCLQDVQSFAPLRPQYFLKYTSNFFAFLFWMMARRMHNFCLHVWEISAEVSVSLTHVECIFSKHPLFFRVPFLTHLGSVHGERANFAVLVLFCIDASDSESRRIFQHFMRSTRFSLLRTATNPKIQQKLAGFFPHFY